MAAVTKNFQVRYGLDVGGQITSSGNLVIQKAGASAKVGATSGAAYFYVDRVAGQTGAIFFQTSTSNRWALLANNVEESGSDAGSNFSINRYKDDGSYIDAPLVVSRATGASTFSGVVRVPYGSVSAPSFTFTSDTDTGVYGTEGYVRVAAGGSEVCRFFTYGTIPIVQTDGQVQGETLYGTHLSAKTTDNTVACYLTADYDSFTTHIAQLRSARTASSAFNFLTCSSDYDGTVDHEFRLRGDGNAYCDTAWNNNAADYAEYFEWADGNVTAEDRRGWTVVLQGDQVVPAESGQDPIGVVSAFPSVVGDSAWNHWKYRYLRSDFGDYLLDESGERVPNPTYDPEMEYVAREDRVEWDCVGLLGKLRVRKGQPIGSRWIKMRDVSDQVEEWLVR